MSDHRRLWRAVAALTAVFSVAMAGAILSAIVDLYRSGHAGQPFGARRFLDIAALGVHLSVADALVIGTAGMAGLAVWFLPIGQTRKSARSDIEGSGGVSRTDR